MSMVFGCPCIQGVLLSIGSTASQVYQIPDGAIYGKQGPMAVVNFLVYKKNPENLTSWKVSKMIRDHSKR